MSTPKTPKIPKKAIVELSAELQSTVQAGWFALRSPYSAPLVDGLKQRIPSAGRSYEPSSKTWKIAEAYRPMVKILLDEAQIKAIELPGVSATPITVPVSAPVSVPVTAPEIMAVAISNEAISEEAAAIREERFRAAGLEKAIKPPVIPEDVISPWVSAFQTLSVPERMLAYQSLSKALSERNEGWPIIQAAWTQLTG